MSKKSKNQRLGRGLGSLLGASIEAAEEEEKVAPAIPVVKPVEEENKANVDDKKQALVEEKKKIEAVAESKQVQVVEKIVYKEAKVPEGARVWRIAIDKLIPNNYQPRQYFDKEKVQELSDSIKEQGILQPIVARKTSDQKFEIISGERRWRAAQMAGLHDVPVIIKDVEDQRSLELALIENIQRADLNPVEEAEAYQRLANEFQLTQEQVAKKVGKNRATVANLMRLLGLSREIRTMIAEGKISQGHAKVLLSVEDPVRQREIAKKIVSDKLSVRAVEHLASQKAVKDTKPEASLRPSLEISNRLAEKVAEDLQKALGTKLKIDYSSGKGKFIIHFYSDEQFNEIADKLKV